MGAHTISRFVDRRFCLVDDIDRQSLHRAITLADERWDWIWLSYAEMSSHVHYGHVAGSTNPDRFFRSAHTRFAGSYHGRDDRETLGPVFAQRPTIHPVPTRALPRLVAYHHRNPVEAGVVDRPRDSSWTSHRAYLRLEPPPPWLDVERALDILGFRDNAAGRRRFDEFVTEVDLDASEWVSEPAPELALRRESAPVDWLRLIDLARQVADLPAGESLLSRRRGAVRTRALVALVATRDLNQTYTVVGAQLGILPGSVFNLLHRNAAAVEGLASELRRRLIVDAAAE
ncbi:MAG: hypothetical protein H6719_20780 [Sandaracinaceae bacterium]|nr:hypothetical protein [Sandaracinaceae bacterium]